MKDDKILNQEQLSAIHHGDGPLLIIAGAGTGKTTVVTERIKYLISQKNIAPSEILALTFTDKAAREMEERVDIAMPYGYTQMWISTFHAFCDRVLRADAFHIGLNPGYKLATESESVFFLRQNIFKLNLEYFRPLGNPTKFLQGLLQHFSRLKDEDVSPEEYLTWAQKQKGDPQETKKTLELAQAYKTYEELKVKENIMDFSDLTSNTLMLFRQRPNVLAIYQNQFKYMLVDEFQDTNFAQNELAKLLAGKKQNITVVGDDDQAIYRWRGAAVSNMIQFRQFYKNAKIVTLTKNYRSTKQVLEKSYRLIQNNNPDRLEVKENVNKKLTSERKVKGTDAVFLFANRVEDEAEKVVEKIKELTISHKLSPIRYDYKDIAILLRANDHAQPFVRALERHGIPFQFLGPGRLFHREEIKDLIAYLKVLYNYEDSASMYRVLNMPIFKLEARDVAMLLNLSKKKNLSLFEAMEDFVKPQDEEEFFETNALREKIKTITDMIGRHLKRVSKDTAGQILYYFVQDCGILDEMLKNHNEQVAQNISRFFEKLKTFEIEHTDASVFAVVDWIELSMQMGESPLATDTDWSENNAVNLLTIHSSKGLEFPVVFLVNLVSQRFPTRQRSEQIPIPQELIKEILPEGDFHLQEERRLCYVGMTRSRDHLYLSAAHYYGEGKRERKLSPFVYEIFGEEHVEAIVKKQKETPVVSQPSLLEWSENKNSEQKLKTNDQRPTTKLTYVSYSQIQTFDICPLHYKLKYVLKVPTPNSAAQSFGTSLHSVLRDMYNSALSGKKVTLDDAYSMLKTVWIDQGYTGKSHAKKAYEGAQTILKNYFTNNFDQKHLTTAAVEVPFIFSLYDQTRDASLKIGGRIDRVDKLNGKIEIIDYKTGTNMPDEKQLAANPQLSFYALAATKVHDKLFDKKADDVLLSLLYLEENKKFTTSRTEEQLKNLESWLFEKADEIAKSDFACGGNMLCANCEYKILCKG